MKFSQGIRIWTEKLNDQVVPQSQYLVEIWPPSCKILYQSEVFVVIFLQNSKFYIQVVGVVFRPKKLSKSVLTFSNVYLVGTD